MTLRRGDWLISLHLDNVAQYDLRRLEKEKKAMPEEITPTTTTTAINLESLKAKLSDVQGIDSISLTNIGGRSVFGWNGLMVAVDPVSSEDQVETAIRQTAEHKKFVPKPKPRSVPAPGSFAAQIRGMLDEARGDLEQTKARGLERVRGAISKMHDAKDATARYAETTAQMVEDQTQSILDELGQFSNMPPEVPEGSGDA